MVLTRYFAGGFADVGPFQFNTTQLVAYSSEEGLRLGIGGRTTPKLINTRSSLLRLLSANKKVVLTL